jgi:oligopeptide/dipeptide ABC transporter ATP-binding protein
MTLLQVHEAVVEFKVSGGFIRALDGVSREVDRGETLAIVGESGCGKTTLARAVLGLQPLAEGKITLGGQDVQGIRPDQAKSVGMIWQDPFASLDPRWTIEQSILEPIRLQNKQIDIEGLMKKVGLDRQLGQRFPHQLSGGQRQRAAIARALALEPPLVICDEPTAALDLSVQAQILNLLKDIQQDFKASYLYISHDLLTVRYLADRIAVMYLGRVLETGPTEEVFQQPMHPYTQALLDSAPKSGEIGKLPEPLQGEIPDPRTPFEACRFASRCPFVQELCNQCDPGPIQQMNQIAFCHFPLGISRKEVGAADPRQ